MYVQDTQFLIKLNYRLVDHTAAAAAKSLQPCPTLCDPRDGSPPGSPVPGILQARTLEWVAIPFSLLTTLGIVKSEVASINLSACWRELRGFPRMWKMGKSRKKIKDEEKKVHRLIGTSITSTLDKSKQNRNDNQEHYRRVLSWNDWKWSDTYSSLHTIKWN